MNQSNEEETLPPGNMFTRTLGEISHGDLMDQSSEMLQQLAIAVRETGKKGTLTLTIEVKPRGRDCGQVEVSGQCVLKAPVSDIAPSMLFVSEDGQFFKDNPAQLKMDFADMPKPLSKTANQ